MKAPWQAYVTLTFLDKKAQIDNPTPSIGASDK